MLPRTIAIDGPAGSGKSTIGYALSEKLGYAMLDTGMLYRLVAVAVRDGNLNSDDEELVAQVAGSTLSAIEIQYDDRNRARVSFQGTPVEELELHSAEISQLVPRVSRHPAVRSHVKFIQKKMIESGFTIVAGRDIGTVVAPNAELKLYLDVSLQERAARRMWSEATGKTTQQRVENDLAARDAMDRGRKASPLTVPPDALVVRTDKLSVAEAVEIIIQMCGISPHSGALS